MSLVRKTDSGTLNNTYLNTFDIFYKVLKKQFEIKNFEIKNLIGTLTIVSTILGILYDPM